MGAAEGDAAQHKVFGDVGGEDEAVGEAAVGLFLIDLHPREQRREDGEYPVETVESAEEAALVVLQVAVVGERDALSHRQQVDKRAGELP
ncbi:hypothetical protein SDC9_136633 [bioreactor metagenome]|uniref:Uncharacterized protein n=1 Tax=bioreactor metagenome TaxID=1076179 RepID=A0A645DJ94_9ZZZZ